LKNINNINTLNIKVFFKKKFMAKYIPLKNNLLCKYVIEVNPKFGKSVIKIAGKEPEKELIFNFNKVIVLDVGEDVNPKIKSGMTLILSPQRNFANEIVNKFENKGLLIEDETNKTVVPLDKDVEVKIIVNENYISCIFEEETEKKPLLNIKPLY
jgi:hypothetical protein